MMMNQMYELSESLFGGDVLDDACSLYWDQQDIGSLMSDINKIPHENTKPQEIFFTDVSCLDEMLTNDFLSQPIQSPVAAEVISSPQSSDYSMYSTSSSCNDLSILASSPLSLGCSDLSTASSPLSVVSDISDYSPISSEQKYELNDFELERLLGDGHKHQRNQKIVIPLKVETEPEAGSNLNVLVVDQSGHQSVQPLLVSDESIPQNSADGFGSKGKLKMLSSNDKKARKRNQNKNAATRYREKKRAEESMLKEELSGLAEDHRKLADKQSQVTREIHYLKELLLEVYKAKGLIIG